MGRSPELTSLYKATRKQDQELETKRRAEERLRLEAGPTELPTIAQIAKELARRSFYGFVCADRPAEYKSARHIRYLCEVLEQVANGSCRRLMIFMPPRSGKSECVSRKFPAWYLGTHPENSVIITSYAADLAEGFSRSARDTLALRHEWFGVNISKFSKSVSDWAIAYHRGRCAAAGVGGPIGG